jgi:hypothetical protein
MVQTTVMKPMAIENEITFMGLDTLAFFADLEMRQPPHSRRVSHARFVYSCLPERVR